MNDKTNQLKSSMINKLGKVISLLSEDIDWDKYKQVSLYYGLIGSQMCLLNEDIINTEFSQTKEKLDE